MQLLNTFLPYCFAAPVLFYATELLLSKKQARYFYLLILANIFAIFAGQIVWSVHLFTLQGAYIVLRLLQQKSSWKERGKLFAIFAFAGFMSILLISFLLGPSLEHKNFLELGYRNSRGLWHQSAMFSIMFFYPKISGALAAPSIWGSNIVNNAFYFGIIPALLVLISLRLKLKKPAWFFLIASVLVFFVITNFLHILELVHHLPFYDTSANTRTRFLLGFCLPVLAAFAFNRVLTKRENLPSSKTLIIGSLVFFLVLLGWLSIYDTAPYILKFENPIIREHLVSQSILILVGICLVSLFAASKKKKFFGTLIIIFTFLELKLLLAPYLTYLPMDKVTPKMKVTDYLLSEQKYESRFLPLSRSFISNFNFHYDLNSLQPRGYYTDRQRKLYQLIEPNTLLKHPTMAFMEWKDLNYDSKFLDLLNVKHIAISPGLGDGSVPKRLENSWKKDFEGELHVYKNKEGYAPAFIIESLEKLSGDEEVYKRLQEIDPTKTAIIEDSDWKIISAKEKLKRKKIIMRRRSHNKINFITHTDKNSFMLFSKFYHPAWKAFMDGKEVPITRANYTFMGINLPAGLHKIRLEYKPSGFHTGLKVSLATGVFLVVLLPIVLFRRKKFAA